MKEKNNEKYNLVRDELLFIFIPWNYLKTRLRLKIKALNFE